MDNATWSTAESEQYRRDVEKAAAMVLEAIADHIANGRKIQAIKIFRAATGLGLKDSKDSVERLASGLCVTIYHLINEAVSSPDVRLALMVAQKKITNSFSCRTVGC